MIIPVHPHGNWNETPEWAMVELQGEIVRKDGDPNTGGYDVGSFSRSKTGGLVLTIGYHQLEGAEEKLKKPFAIIQKNTSEDMAQEQARSYQVIGFVTKKYLFKQRPRALISKPN